MKKLFRPSIVIIVAAALFVAYMEYFHKAPQPDIDINSAEAQYCVAQSGAIVFEGQIGKCYLRDGTKCKLKAFMEGSCASPSAVNTTQNASVSSGTATGETATGITETAIKTTATGADSKTTSTGDKK